MSYSFINTASLSSLLFPMEGESRWGCHDSPIPPQEGPGNSKKGEWEAALKRLPPTRPPYSPTPQLQEATRLRGQLPTHPKPEAPIRQVCCGQFLLSVGWKGPRRQTRPTSRSSLGREGDGEMQITQGRLPQGWGTPKS